MISMQRISRISMICLPVLFVCVAGCPKEETPPATNQVEEKVDEHAGHGHDHAAADHQHSEDKGTTPTEKTTKAAKKARSSKETGLTKAVKKSKAQILAILAKADAMDGETDKVVTRCASCSLKMDGSEENSLKVFDYTLYFCTPRCEKAFAENITKSVLDMPVPKDGEVVHKKEGKDAMIAMKLAQADRLDGTEDKIVTRCASCALRMDGKSEFAVGTHGYTLYFCTEDCAKRFRESMEEAILSMEIPEQ